MLLGCLQIAEVAECRLRASEQRAEVVFRQRREDRLPRTSRYVLVESANRVFQRPVALRRQPHFLRERIGLAEIMAGIGPVEIVRRRAEQAQHEVLVAGEIQRPT